MIQMSENVYYEITVKPCSFHIQKYMQCLCCFNLSKLNYAFSVFEIGYSVSFLVTLTLKRLEQTLYKKWGGGICQDRSATYRDSQSAKVCRDWSLGIWTHSVLRQSLS